MRERIGAALASWARFACCHARAILSLSLALTALLLGFLPSVELDTHLDGFLHEDDPALDLNEQFRQEFGRTTPILVVIETDDVFDLGFLLKLRDLHEDVERSLPLVDEITSLVNVRSVSGEGNELIVRELGEEWPHRAEGLPAFRDRILSHPLYSNLLVSADATAASILIRTVPYSQLPVDQNEILDGFEEVVETPEEGWQPGDPRPPRITPAEEARFVAALFEVVERHQGPGFEILVSGSPIFSLEIQYRIKRDMQRYIALSILMIAALLFLLFRRPSGAVLPLLIVGLATGATIGLMALTGTPIRAPTQVLPSFLLAVGVCDSVHVLTLFYRGFDAGQHKHDAIAEAFAHAGLAIALTTITTAAGIASFAVADLAPVAEFGVFGPIGVGMAFLYTMVMLPALVALLPLRPRRPAASVGRVDRALQGFGTLGTRWPWTVVAISVVLVVLAALGASRVRLAHDPLQWLASDDSLRIHTERVDARFRAVMAVEIMLNSGEPDGTHEPAFLEELDALAVRAAALGGGPVAVGKTHSLVDIVKEIHQALNEERPEFYAIPDRRQTVAQELLLFENSGSGDLQRVANADFSAARLTVRIPWVDAVHYPPFLDALQREIDALDADTSAIMTGGTVVMTRTIDALMTSFLRSYGLCFLVITPLMMLLIGSWRSGLVSAVPNLTPIVLTLGLMGWADIPLGASTLLVACIAIGLAVDDTIHFLMGFERFYARGETAGDAIRHTLLSTGRALLITSCVLASGFFAFTLSSMSNIAHFGLLIGFAIAAAFLADVILAPALLTVLRQRADRDVPA